MPFGPLEQKFFNKLLQPGDVLLFARKGLFNWVIRVASNSPITHTELYLGNGKTSAARNGKGIDTYDLELDGIAVVLTPKIHIDMEGVLRGHKSRIGMGYDWKGLVRAFVRNQWGRTNDKAWCSEATTLDLRDGGVEPFVKEIPADMVAPGDFLKSAAFIRKWVAKDFKV